GSINLITKALANVGCKMEVVPDPTTVHYHLPGGLSIRVHREFEDFLVNLPYLRLFAELLCFVVSTVKALWTPMVNASMVLCDRHFGGINYPIGGIGGIAKNLAKGLVDNGRLLRVEEPLKEEQNFQSLYVKAPSFLFIHVGIKECFAFGYRLPSFYSR
ncbi:hypothetical protein KI387_002785, partial [Taxus chinensis]